MEVIIEDSSTGGQLLLDVFSGSTIGNIKEDIKRELGFPIIDQILVFDGFILDDDDLTEAYEIPNGALVYLELQPSMILVALVPPYGSPEIRDPVAINIYDNVNDLRSLLEEVNPALTSEYKFFYDEQAMDEQRTFFWYGIREGGEVIYIKLDNDGDSDSDSDGDSERDRDRDSDDGEYDMYSTDESDLDEMTTDKL